MKIISYICRKYKKRPMSKKEKDIDLMLESILDLNSNNVWNLNEEQIAKLWEKERKEE